MRPANVKSYAPAFALGEVMTAGGVSEVIKSKNPEYKEGDIVTGMVGWENYSVVPEGKDLRKIDNARQSPIPLSYHLGVLGMPGMTAYAGLFKIGEPKKGETIFISAASGAVGQVVGQIAKVKGLRVVGTAGDDSKVEYLLKELKFDAAFNYKKVDLDQALSEACPNGIDVYFENVGGKMLDVVLKHCNDFARIPVCGMISQYNRFLNPEPIYNIAMILTKRIRFQGFIVREIAADYAAQFAQDVPAWIKEGKLIYKDDQMDGIENAPEAFLRILRGENFGKQVVKLADL
ncbi:NAD(P)-binding protein [Basidiobolus meristosporus CBS 931.73]|uniref:NAD(P)-binding protein n=1 Tax=Basidiobolus meristosporus CBS 931.73 TaxID=1314790 RepID=A0A1Y1W1L0_9FUNG|nr:NAD(P)-binding protein [Basidiobolus meristosporus CBS 931.73]ORX66994.1 NAD(P)-binding protein [Basidiobolus meristosporus CBS 931.73]ORX99764.1 NAD(P)-binding protein [Basidiobolus meristosporus CBS 931.73]|eukprot:ORX66993.1 NAD(P)-binding protein [Basidiobolus meristosporus CBS 931.73]